MINWLNNWWRCFSIPKLPLDDEEHLYVGWIDSDLLECVKIDKDMKKALQMNCRGCPVYMKNSFEQKYYCTGIDKKEYEIEKGWIAGL